MTVVLRLLLAMLAVLPLAGSWAWESEWTVVTLSRDGSWGIFTAKSQGMAIAGAVRDCKASASGDGDCGAQQIALRSGWALAHLCDGKRVMVSGPTLGDAERAAHKGVVQLVRDHGIDPRTCRYLVKIQTGGSV